MGFLFSGPKAPPPPPAPASLASSSVQGAGRAAQEAASAAAGQGFEDTLKTSNSGSSAAYTAKTQLGQ